MNCQQSEERIHELLDQRKRLRDDLWLSDHRRACNSCDLLVSEFECLEEHFENWSQERAIGHQVRMARNAAWPATPRGTGWDRRRLWSFAAIAATLLIVALPLWRFRPNAPAARVADVNHTAPAPVVPSPATEVPWPELLATFEELPKHLDSLGPVYACTAQMTGVSPLTSSLHLTVDWLKAQLNRSIPWPTNIHDSQGLWRSTEPFERWV